MLLDSNIIIYSVQPENSRLRQFIAEREPAVSALSYLEVLGYHQLTDDARLYFNQFFDATRHDFSNSKYGGFPVDNRATIT